MAGIDIQDIIGNIVSKDSVDKIAKMAGTDSETTSSIISKALPEVLQWIWKEANTEKWLQWLSNALDSKHTWEVFNRESEIDIVDGGKIMDHVMWDKSQKVIESVATSLWVSQQQAKSVISGMGPVVLWSLWKAKKEWKLDISSLGSILSSDSIINSNLIGSFLDKDGDGDIKDDLFTMALNYIKKAFLKK